MSVIIMATLLHLKKIQNPNYVPNIDDFEWVKISMRFPIKLIEIFYNSNQSQNLTWDEYINKMLDTYQAGEIDPTNSLVSLKSKRTNRITLSIKMETYVRMCMLGMYPSEKALQDAMETRELFKNALNAKKSMKKRELFHKALFEYSKSMKRKKQKEKLYSIRDRS